MKRALLLLLVTCLVTVVHGQMVKGLVSSSEGEPLVGATVLVKGTTTGTVTDLDGHYEIT